ncbi:mitogen-activated protein kinase kinase kinase 13 isoform X3 [Atheta coriaria]|uniref:mitogen-activated protein kinase kinase kinase 13 isoform X3 n=1 Tax=Dalotia coriaria TaxID=877792 RepID=UPI0031F469A5
MHTPEGTLERGHHAPSAASNGGQNITSMPVVPVLPPNALNLPPFTAPTKDSPGDVVIDCEHVLSDPEKFTNSMLCIQDELGQLNIHQGSNDPGVVVQAAESNKSSPDTPHILKPTWMDGFLGCLRPVFSIIGKAGANEIRDNQDDWEIPFEQITNLDLVGCGGQGIVFYGKYKNEDVAVKKVQELKETDIRNLRKLNHPNIVKFKGVCTQPPCYCIVMEFCADGTLYDVLKKQDNSVTPTKVVSWSKQIASGMHYLHSHKIIHRDLKSPNVLIGQHNVVKISDFGTSRTWNGMVSTKMSFAGTVAWMSPEAIQESACSEKVDIWSFGVVLWELLTCEIPYKDMEQSAIMYMVGCGKLHPPIPKTCPEGFKLIMQMCWKFNPKDRPSFKLICNHLEIAGVEYMSAYEEQSFFERQEKWKTEIASQITQFKTQLKKRKMKFELQEEQLIEKRENELKHIRDIKILYDRKLERVNQLYYELSVVLLQLDQQKQEGRKREMQGKRKLIQPFMKKLEKRRTSQNSTTPTSPECSLTSPESPKIMAAKPLYTQLNATNQPESTTLLHSQGSKTRKRHHRTNSGSPRNSRTSSNRTSILVDTETQTDYMDISEPDLSPNCIKPKPSATPQRVILKEFPDADLEGNNGNCVQLHYLSQSMQPEVELYTLQRLGHRSTTPDDRLDESDNVNSNSQTRDYSDEDTLETIGRKVSEVSEIISANNGNMFTDRLAENGNVSEDIEEVLRKRRCSDTRHTTLDSGEEDVANDSCTDEEGEIGRKYSLRRIGFARRPIYPGRRSSRYKMYQRDVVASDEGNTSEYSNPPSSKSSTLESNAGRTSVAAGSTSIKRTQSDALSDSESDDFDLRMQN